jgi:hypothetical protein
MKIKLYYRLSFKFDYKFERKIENKNNLQKREHSMIKNDTLP